VYPENVGVTTTLLFQVIKALVYTEVLLNTALRCTGVLFNEALLGTRVLLNGALCRTKVFVNTAPQGGENAYETCNLSCRSHFSKEPLIIGFFRGN